MAAAALASSRGFAFDDDPPPCARETSPSYLGPSAGHLSLRKKKTGDQDEELDVFRAEKYFSSGIDGDELAAKPEKPWKLSPAIERGSLPGRNASLLGTQSAGSEASERSRGALLKNERKGPSQRPQRSQRRLLGIFWCYCSDGASVEVGANSKDAPASWPGAPMQVRPETACPEEKAGGGLCPTGEGPPCGAIVGQFEEERKRGTPTMYVFGDMTTANDVLSGATGFRRSLTLSPAFTTTGGYTTRDSDACSESSSDLFEIEHLSFGPRPPTGRAGTAATQCYEPSESSIKWSVVTASAVNFSDLERSPPEARRAAGRQLPHRPGGLLPGCVSHKAVSTASNTYRIPQNAETAERLRRNGSIDATPPATRCLAEGRRSADFDRRLVGHVLAGRGVFQAHLY